MASLSSLYSELSRWNSRLSDLNAKLNKLKRRKTDTEGVKNALRTVVNNNSNDINNRLRTTRQKLENAIDYSGKEHLLDAILSGKEERTLGVDDNLTSADVISRELNT